MKLPGILNGGVEFSTKSARPNKIENVFDEPQSLGKIAIAHRHHETIGSFDSRGGASMCFGWNSDRLRCPATPTEPRLQFRFHSCCLSCEIRPENHIRAR